MFFLAKHAFVCSDGASYVFLDIKRDQYSAVAARDAEGLAAIVPGWPCPNPASAEATSARTERTVRELLEREILTPDEADGKAAWPVAMPTPARSLWPPYDPLLGNSAGALPSTRIITRFMVACLRARTLLKWRSLAYVLDRHAQRHPSPVKDSTGAPVPQALVSDFRALRPLVFTSAQQCLFHSLALAEFLAFHDVSARWVFGVQFSPFAAHCWLQQDDVVYNDNIEHVRRFTPIMAA